MDHDDFRKQWVDAVRRQALRDVELSRRELIRQAGRAAFGFGVLTALAACGGTTVAPATAAAGGASTTTTGSGTTTAGATPAVKLPEITSIPDKLKGSGVVRVASYGGAFQDAQRQAYFKPFEQLSGIKVVESEGPDVAKVKAMVDTKNIEWDVAEFDRGDVINLEKKGDYWEKINYDLVDTANIDAAYRYDYSLDMLPYAQIYAYRTDVFKDAKPSGWADFWNTAKFPGPRTMPGGTGGLSPDLEAAMLATGVSMDKVYPIDIQKAYDSLSKIKQAVVKWWDAGAIPAQMLANKEAVMGTAWNGRIAAIQAQGAPVDIAWAQGQLLKDAWAIPKGAPNRDNAQKFTAFITLPISQARLSMLIPYGFVNSKAADYVPPDRLKVLPTSPDIVKQLYQHDSQWWADNRDQVLQQWATWILS